MPVRRMQTALPQPPGAAEAAGGEIYADVQPGGGGGAGVSAVERAAQQECASRGKPSASAEKNGGSTSGSSGGGGGGEGWYNLQLIERVNALFDGDSLRKFQARSAPHCEAPSAHQVTPEASR